MLQSRFREMKIKGKSVLPIVQGGMGVGVSAHRLAGNVAKLGAVGTISSVDLRRHHQDLMDRCEGSRDKALIDDANLTALDREIRAAKGIACGNGLVAVNIMRAVSQYSAYVRQACASGADAVVVGAGLPLDLPDLTAEYPDVALIPILSDARGIALVLKKWMRKNRLPDAIVIENPRYAGGHLGASQLDEVNHPHFAYPAVLEPSAVQLGTPFAVTEEGDAHPVFKKVLANAKAEDIVTFMSAAGLPARAVRTPWLVRYLRKEAKLQAKAKPKKCTVGFDCLSQCGWRDGNEKAGQFCIDTQLAFALEGDIDRGLFFRGSEPLPFGNQVRPVSELIRYMLTGARPAELDDYTALCSHGSSVRRSIAPAPTAELAQGAKVLNEGRRAVDNLSPETKNSRLERGRQ